MSIWAVSAQLAITLLGAGTSIILNRTLGPEGRGAVGVVMLWPLLLAGVAGAGWVSALGISMSRSPEMCRANWSAAQLAGLAISGVTCCLGWRAIPWLMHDEPELWELGRWFLPIIPLTFLGQAALAGLEALQRYDLSTRVRIGNPLGVLCLLVPLAALQALTPQNYCAVFLVAQALTAVHCSWLLAKASSGSWRPQWGPMLANVLRSAPLTWALVLQFRVDQLVIALSAPADPAAFGGYVVGTTLAGMVSPIAQGLALVLLPESARRAEADAGRLFTRMGRLFVLGAIVLALPVALAAPWILTLFYGSEFASAAYALRIGLLTAVLAGLVSMGVSTIQGTGRPGAATIIGVISALLSVMGSALLLPFLGYMGAALGQALGLLVGLCMIGTIYRREGLPLLSLIPRRDDVMSLWAVAPRVLGYTLVAPEPPASVDKPPVETTIRTGFHMADESNTRSY